VANAWLACVWCLLQVATIHDLLIHPDMQGYGLGAGLLQRCVNQVGGGTPRQQLEGRAGSSGEASDVCGGSNAGHALQLLGAWIVCVTCTAPDACH
jgi:GNAT superfamily N-acetyltransferase